MKTFHGIDEYEAFFVNNRENMPEVALALGKFDGIHSGHAKLFDDLTEEAGKRKLKTLIFTFDKPFSAYFSGNDPEVLTTYVEREEAVKRWGIDYLIEYPLNEDTVGVEADRFIDDILVRRLRSVFIAAGPDMSYGRGGKGNIDLLKEKAGDRYEVLVVPKVMSHEGEIISSSLVRDELKTGNMEKVTGLLGRPYSIIGKVSRGRKLGSSVLDMPTVNIIPEKYKLLPLHGVYFSETVVGSEKYKSITNIGVKPTVQRENKVNAETFLYDFDDDLYGENIQVDLLHFHRKEMKFESLDDLKRQMLDDKMQGMRFNAAQCHSEQSEESQE
ncbi:MAG: riboflavin biosynthesis protein RibF [Lachnospiraceae bacterium]|nr:riboflavin biosynthesis protein RibF [Lachnospiraceae bacterium]